MIPALVADEDRNLWAFKTLVYFAVGLVALLVHSYLLPKKTSDRGEDDDDLTF